MPFLNTFMHRFLNLLIQAYRQFNFHFLMRHRDQLPFVTQIIIYFLSVNLKNLFFPLKLSFVVINIKLSLGKIHFIPFSHLFRKVHLIIVFL